jgi:Holliday junction resolvasome RuvABC endonuclease subunit
MSSVEARTITYERFEPRTPTERGPWCAVIHGIARGRRLVSVPIHVNAAPFLHALLDAAASEGRLPIGPLFESRRKGGSPLSYSHVVRIRRGAVAGAALPRCDDTTLTRAYAAYLKQCGLNEYAIRDALGVKLMETVDRHLRPSRRAASQRIAAEHHLIEPPKAPANDPGELQLPLPLEPDLGKEPVGGGAIRLIGIDCAYRRSGWAILTRGLDGRPTLAAYGAIVPRGQNRSHGLMSIEKQVRDILREWKPTGALLEKPGRWIHREGSSRHSIEVMAMARGTMLKVCGELAIPAQEVDFQQVRLALLGRANATKASAVELVSYLGLGGLPRRPRGGVDLDVVDAIMMALYGLDYGLWTDGGDGDPSRTLRERFPDLQDR